MILILPKEVRNILNELKSKGFDAYAVGGCVRDALLSKEPRDWDITTSATPEEVRSVFKRTVDTGIKHGTVTVMKGGRGYEVTTFRIDGDYKDGRHPESVSFSRDLKDDLKRRDFTINAMAYDEDRGLVDLFRGREDLDAGLIRCVGDPDERFGEDALRILRAVRFSAQLGFEIEKDTREAIARHAPSLKAVSRERIMAELTRLICSAHAEKISLVFELGLDRYIADCFEDIDYSHVEMLAARKSGAQETSCHAPDPAFDISHETDDKHSYIRFTFLTLGMDSGDIDRMLRSLRADNFTRERTVKLAENILKPLPADRFHFKKVMSGFTPELFSDLLNAKAAIRELPLYKARCAEEDIKGAEALREEIITNREPVYLSELAVTGEDLKRAGFSEGPEIGRVLRRLQELVWERPDKNTKEAWLWLEETGKDRI